MTKKVFISYTREDQHTIRELHDDLSAIGNNAFFDQELTGGQSWWSTLLRGIRDCDIFMPVVGDAWLESIPCQMEADYAQRLGKQFLPVVLGEVSIKLLPPAVAETQWVRYDHQDTDSILSLVRAINSLGVSGPLPEPLPPEPSVPISYLTELREQVQVTHDIPRRDQELLLNDFRRRIDTGRDLKEICMLLRTFRNRDDLNVHVATEIDSLLASADTVAPENAGSTVADRRPPAHETTPSYAPPRDHAVTSTPVVPGPAYQPPSYQPVGASAPAQGNQPQHAQPLHNQPPSYQPSPSQAPVGTADLPGGSKIVWSYVCSAIAVFFIPILFGPVAMVLANSAKKLGNPKGATAFNVAIGATIAGIIFGIMLLTG